MDHRALILEELVAYNIEIERLEKNRFNCDDEKEESDNEDERVESAVLDILKELGMEQYSNRFIQNDVLTIDIFRSVDDGKLKEMGVGVMGHRMKIAAHAEEFKKAYDKERKKDEEKETKTEEAQQQLALVNNLSLTAISINSGDCGVQVEE